MGNRPSSPRGGSRPAPPAGGCRRAPAPYDQVVQSQVVTRLTARAAALPPRVQDLALALALVLVNVASVLPYRSQLHPFWAALVLVIAQCVPLAWRRRWPLAVLIVAGIPRILYDQLAFAYAPFPLANTIAFYTAMVYCRPAVRRVVIVLVVIGSIESQVSPGHTQPYDAVVSALTTLGAWGAAVVVRNRQAGVQEAESRAERAEAERDNDVARAAADERTRIARELHDVVAHHVSLMAVQAEAASSLLPARPDDAARSVEVIADTARQALTELRRLLGVLRGPSDHLETAPSMSLADLGPVLDQVRGTGLAVELIVQGTPGPLAPGVDLTAYRIIQEALTNTLRHANAARAAVGLCYEPGFVTVSVTDTRSGAGDRTGRQGAWERCGERSRGRASERDRAGPVRRLRAGRDRGTGRLLRRQPVGGSHRRRGVRGHRPAAGPGERPGGPGWRPVPDPGPGGRRPGTGPGGILCHPRGGRGHQRGGRGVERRRCGGRRGGSAPGRGADGHPDAGDGRAGGDPADHRGRPGGGPEGGHAHHVRPRRLRLRGAPLRGERVPAQGRAAE